MGILTTAAVLLVFGAGLASGNCNVGAGMVKVEIEGFSVYFDAASKATYDAEPVKSNMQLLFNETVQAVRFLAPNAFEEVMAILRAVKVILHSAPAAEHHDGNGTAWAMNGFLHECADGTPGGGSEGCVEGFKFDSSDLVNGNLVEWLSPIGGRASSLLLHELSHVYYFHLNPDRTSSKVVVAVVEAFDALKAKHDEIKAKHAAPQADFCNVWGSCSHDDYAFLNHGEFHAEVSEALTSEDRKWENDKWPNTRAELFADAGETIATAVEAVWQFDAAGLAEAEREACVSRELPACKGCDCENPILQILGCFDDGQPSPDKCKAECYAAYTEYITAQCQHKDVVKQVQDTCTPPTEPSPTTAPTAAVADPTPTEAPTAAVTDPTPTEAPTAAVTGPTPTATGPVAPTEAPTAAVVDPAKVTQAARALLSAAQGELAACSTPSCTKAAQAKVDAAQSDVDAAEAAEKPAGNAATSTAPTFVLAAAAAAAANMVL